LNLVGRGTKLTAKIVGCGGQTGSHISSHSERSCGSHRPDPPDRFGGILNADGVSSVKPAGIAASVWSRTKPGGSSLIAISIAESDLLARLRIGRGRAFLIVGAA